MLRNITLSADEILINQARQKALLDNTSVNKLFREWIYRYVNKDNVSNSYESLMNDFSSINSGRKFSRKEMNER